MATTAEARVTARRMALGETNGFLGTRFVGREARERAEAALEKGLDLVLDWRGVDMVSQSFADEFVGKLALEMGREEFKRRVRFANLDPAVASIVRYTLALRLAPPKTLH